LLVAHFCPGGLGLGLGLTVFHQSGDPLGPTLSFSHHRCAHTHWNRTSASQQFRISLGQTVTILRITARSGLEAEMIRLQGRKTVTSGLCKALVTNPHVLLAEVASDSAPKPIVGPCSQSVQVSVHQDRIRQAAIEGGRPFHKITSDDQCAKKKGCSIFADFVFFHVVQPQASTPGVLNQWFQNEIRKRCLRCRHGLHTSYRRTVTATLSG